MALITAAPRGSFQKNRTLIATPAGKESVLTPLMSAVERGYACKVELLLEYGANVNTIHYDFVTPLHYARDAKIATALITKGANIEAKDSYGNTPLHVAAINNCGSLTALLEAGADINSKNIYNATPLQFAVSSGAELSVQILIEAGAKIDSEIWTKLSLAQNIRVQQLVRFSIFLQKTCNEPVLERRNYAVPALTT